MTNAATISRIGAIGITLLSLLAGNPALMAQAVAEVPPAKSASPEDLSQVELLKSYLQVREQLHAAQLAIVNNRLEAEATARAQAAAITEKLEAIRSNMAAERERQLAETRRVEAERQRLEAEMQQSNRTVVLVVSLFGGVSLLAMLFTTLFQWRSVSRIAEITALRPQLPTPAGLELLPGGSGTPFDRTVTQSNQRLLSVVDRMEQRILELENTAGRPLPAAPANGRTDSNPSPRAAAATEQATRINVLLSKGGYLLSTNKPRDAVACYDEVLKLDARHAEAMVRKGAALERMTQDDEALRCYDRAIEVDGRMTLAYLYKGGVCNRLGRHDEAIKCYEQALQAAKDGK